MAFCLDVNKQQILALPPSFTWNAQNRVKRLLLWPIKENINL